MNSLSLFISAFLLASVLTARAIDVGPRAVPPFDASAYSAVFHVDPSVGSDISGDGSAGRPWASLAHALEAAGSGTAQRRVAVLLCAGVYHEPTFALKAHVDIYGGFAVAGGARDTFRHRSVIDGRRSHRIAIGADHVRLDGLTFVNGRVSGKGAALYCDGVSPVVSDCMFIENRTTIPEGWAPPLLHETANDGGAVMCLNGAAPRFERCVFFGNATECGRGGALACDRAARPVISRCVFANNRAGLDDPMRSSDGGAVSYFDHCAGEFSDNVVVANVALSRNDAGGVFVALWSAPRIGRNVIVGNECGDDAGGLFVGGQEHRYDAPLDTYPPADRFTVEVVGNLLVGNVNGSRNSGATRITMESRVRLADNVIAENAGGLYLQRSEVVAERNTVWQDWRFVEDKPSLGPSVFRGNIFKGPSEPVEARATFSGNMMDAKTAGAGTLPVSDIFEADGVKGGFVEMRFDPAMCTTILTTAQPLPDQGSMAGRAIKLSDSVKGGQWRVIKSATGSEIVLWGRLEPSTKPPKYFEILRTFRVKAGAARDVGASVPPTS